MYRGDLSLNSVCMIAAASNRTAGILAAAGAEMILAGRHKNAIRAIYKRLADARPEF
jgi:NADP-dependent 3-hydroxy acid dehydrogenase YdfG